MATRLDSIAPDLGRRIEQASADEQRRVAAAAAQLVEQATRVDDPAMAAALDAVRTAAWGDTPQRRAALNLVERLDEAAWDAQDRAEEQGTGQDEYTAAFRAARAASAIAFALADEPAQAALEAVYEAEAATADLEGVRRVVDEILHGS